jgi:hypothetical protein
MPLEIRGIQISDSDGQNAISLAIERAAKMAKADKYRDVIDKVLVTPEVVSECSDVVRLTLHNHPGGEFDFSTASTRSCFTPAALDRRTLLHAYRKRLASYTGQPSRQYIFNI